jgi:hypothetical protein
MVTAASLKDPQVLGKVEAFAAAGGNVIATAGFIIGALQKCPDQLGKLTSVSYTNRTLTADEFQCAGAGPMGKNYIKTAEAITYRLLEHRNNATWSVMNAGHGEYHESVLCYDTYGKGRLTILNLPEMPSRIYDLPPQALTQIRRELEVSGIWIDGAAGVSLFTYDNKTFGLYCHTWDGCAPQEFFVHVKGEANQLKRLNDGSPAMPWSSFPMEKIYSRPLDPRNPASEKESVFYVRIQPGDFCFFQIQ